MQGTISEHTEIFETESSDRAFEEEVMIVGFGNASVKAEGNAVDLITLLKALLHVMPTKQLL